MDNSNGTNPTAKRVAAAIIRSDIAIIDHWQERHPEIASRSFEEVNDHIEKILAPFYDRLDAIAKDVTPFRQDVMNMP